MRKVLILALALSLISGMAFADSLRNPSSHSDLPVIMDNGGPDTYGYYWEDNANHGSVPFDWMDLESIGTAVEGLGDDNNVGPFQLGFDFPYYWYTVGHIWIGSNGYTSFSSNANFAHPFADIPSPQQPNDLLAVLAGDLDFSRGNPECYYWTNNSDSFVVEWKNVGEFGYIDSLHTFEMVLNATDSSITYYYGEQHGDFYDSNGENKDVIGIEAITGTVGLQYMRDNSPSGRFPIYGRALRFHPEPDTAFSIDDIGVLTIFNDQNGAKLFAKDFTTTIKGQVKNFGTEDESGFNVYCDIRDPDNNLVYRDTVMVDDVLPASGTIWVDFKSLTPEMVGQYRVDMRTSLSGDELPSNNSKRAELRVVDFGSGDPVEIGYDDGQADDARAWNGDFSGFGNEFESPYLPMDVYSVEVNIGSITTAGNLHVWLMDDDGTGNPGDILAADTIMVDTSMVDSTGWGVVADFSADNIQITSGKVFAVGIAELQSTLWFGVDNTGSSPFSYRGWEYTGGLAADRDRESEDIMIHITASATPTGVDNNNSTDSNLPKEISLSQNYPNPFNPTTNISYSLPVNSDVSLEVFNIKGEKVRTLVNGNVSAGTHDVTWNGISDNGSKVSSGVYFYRLNANGESVVRRMTIVK